MKESYEFDENTTCIICTQQDDWTRGAFKYESMWMCKKHLNAYIMGKYGDPPDTMQAEIHMYPGVPEGGIENPRFVNLMIAPGRGDWAWSRNLWESFKNKVDNFFAQDGVDQAIEAFNKPEARQKRQEEQMGKWEADMKDRLSNPPKPKIDRRWLYVLLIESAYPVPITKIGIAADIRNRLRTYDKSFNGYKLLFKYEILSAGRREKELCKMFADKKCTAGNEWFVLDEQDHKHIEDLVKGWAQDAVA